MSSDEEKEKHRKRLKKTRSIIAKELLTAKYKQKRIERKRTEDEEERRFRRYKELNEEI